MNYINVSQARQILLTLINKVYQGQEFIISKNKIPVARLSPIEKRYKIFPQKKILPEARRLFKHLKGSREKIAKWLRESPFKRSYK